MTSHTDPAPVPPTGDAVPQGLTARPLTVDDADQIAELYAEIEAAEPADEHLGVDDVREELAGPLVDLPRASLALLDGDRIVGAVAVTALHDAASFKAYSSGGVRPERWREGLGSFLLHRSRELARQRRDREAPGLPGTLEMWVEEKRLSTQALVDALGFRTLRWFHRMQRDLSAPVTVPPAPAGFELRPYRAEDAEAVRLARNDAFRDHWGSFESTVERWQAHMVGSRAFRPEHCVVATFTEQTAPADGSARPGDVAAFVMTEEFDEETRARGYRTAYIALVGTVRAARGHGLASALLAQQMRSAAADGYARAELGVDSDSPTGAGRIYSGAGFEVLERHRTVGLDLD